MTSVDRRHTDIEGGNMSQQDRPHYLSHRPNLRKHGAYRKPTLVEEPPTLGLISGYAELIGCTDSEMRGFLRWGESIGWTDAEGEPMRDWCLRLRHFKTKGIRP